MLPVALLLGVGVGLQKIIDLSGLLALLSVFTRFYFLLIALTVLPVFLFSMIHSVFRLGKHKILLATMLRVIAAMLAIMLICSILALMFYSLTAWLYPLDTEDVYTVMAYNSGSVESSLSLREGAAESSQALPKETVLERFLLSIIPNNIYQSLVIEQLPALIFFSVLLGVMLSIIRHNKVSLLTGFIYSLNLSFQKIFHWLMYFLPVVVFILTARYVQEANLVSLRSTLFLFAIFLGVLLVSVIAAIFVYMKRRETTFVKTFSQMLCPAVLGVFANNHFVALPEIMRTFGNRNLEHTKEPPATGSVISILFSINNIGYFLFLNIFALISMMISGVALTPVSLGVVFFAAFLVSLTSSVYAGHATAQAEHSTLLFSILSSAGVISYLTSGFWIIAFYLLLPLQVFYSIVMNQIIAAILLPKPSQESDHLSIEEQEEDNFNVEQLPGLADDESIFIANMEEAGEESRAALAFTKLRGEDDFSKSGKKYSTAAQSGGLFSISFRLSVIVLTTLLIISYGLLSNVINYAGSVASLYSVTDSFFANLSNSASNEIENYLELPIRVLHDIDVFINQRGMFDENEETVEFIYDIIEGVPEFVALFYGSNDGTFRMVKRMQDKTLSIRRVEQDGQNIISNWEHENPDYKTAFPDSVDSLEEGYDPRRRGWYQSAVEGQATTWSDVYPFASDNQLGLTTALPVYDSNGDVRGVFGIDIGLFEFSNFLNDLDIGVNGHAFVIEKESTEFLAVARPARQVGNDLYYTETINGREEIRRININNTLSPYYRLGYEAYTSGQTITKNSGAIVNFFQFLLGRLQAQGSKHKENYSFTYEKNLYLVSISDISPDIGIDWQLGLIISVDDFMVGVKQNNSVILVFSIFLIILVGYIGSTIASRISNPITKLSNEMEVIKDLKIGEVAQRTPSRIQEIQNMNTAFDSMLRGLLSFKKYVPADLVTQLIQVQGSAEIGGSRQEVTMLFSDVRNFTTMSEQMEPEVLLDNLEEYFDLFSNILLQTHATIDKYIGDAVMAFWGAPLENKTHAIHACHAAVQFQRELKKSNLADQFYTRIGIHTGRPLVGNIGSSKRLNYTVIGDAVNLTSRLENLNKYYGTNIIISETTREQVKDSFEVRYLDNVAVKGRKQGLKIYEVIGDKGMVDLLQDGTETNQHIHQFLSLYNLGVRYYTERQWGKAVHYFARAYNMRKHDQCAKLMYLRCYKFYQSPPPADWDGVVMFREK